MKKLTPDLFYRSQQEENRRMGLREIFTVDSATDRINLRTASAEIIQALVGLSPERSKDFVKQRNQMSKKTLSDLMKLLGITAGDSALRQFVFTNPSVVAIEAA